MRECSNCHFGDVVYPGRPCFNTGCLYDSDHPAWHPKTNGDKVREMTNEELVKLWMTDEFNDKYFPACASDPDNECSHRDIPCESCPNTFANWLGAEAEAEE